MMKHEQITCQSVQKCDRKDKKQTRMYYKGNEENLDHSLQRVV